MACQRTYQHCFHEISHMANTKSSRWPMHLKAFCSILIGDELSRLVHEVDSMRILLADDQPKVRFALRVLLKRQSGLQVVGEAIEAQDLLEQTAQLSPDLILLGWELPGCSTTDLLPSLRSLCPSLVIIALSGRLEARQMALDCGADAFVSKSDPPDRLLAAIEACCNDAPPGV